MADSRSTKKYVLVAVAVVAIGFAGWQLWSAIADKPRTNVPSDKAAQGTPSAAPAPAQASPTGNVGLDTLRSRRGGGRVDPPTGK